MTSIREIYFSIDIEADGPVPNPYSLVSIGAVVAGFKETDAASVRVDLQEPENGFYMEFRPISDQYEVEALAISGLTREYLETNGVDPEIGMTQFAEWVNTMLAKYECQTAVFCAFPLGFDWMWTYWYLLTYSKIGSPFGHSRHIDIKTFYTAKSSKTVTRSTKQNIPKKLRSKLPHTHNALDDAKEQGELLMNLMEWEPDAR